MAVDNNSSHSIDEIATSNNKNRLQTTNIIFLHKVFVQNMYILLNSNFAQFQNSISLKTLDYINFILDTGKVKTAINFLTLKVMFVF